MGASPREWGFYIAFFCAPLNKAGPFFLQKAPRLGVVSCCLHRGTPPSTSDGPLGDTPISPLSSGDIFAEIFSEAHNQSSELRKNCRLAGVSLSLIPPTFKILSPFRPTSLFKPFPMIRSPLFVAVPPDVCFCFLRGE